MAEGTYEYELQRAELLGIEPPNKDDFEAVMREKQEEENARLLELEIQEEQLKNASGKFDEVNSILSITQQRINKFKNVCGSLTNLLKIRSEKDETDAASSSNKCEQQPSSEGNSLEAALDTLDDMKTQDAMSDTAIIKQTATDMKHKMSCQMDALDSMLAKAENAQYSMAKQNNDIKRLLK